MLASKSRSNQEDTPLPERRRVGEDVPSVGVRLNLRHQSRAAALGPVRAPGRGEPGVFDRPRRVRGAVAQEAPAAGARINEVESADAVLLTSAGLGVVAVEEFNDRKMVGEDHAILRLFNEYH